MTIETNTSLQIVTVTQKQSVNKYHTIFVHLLKNHTWQVLYYRMVSAALEKSSVCELTCTWIVE